MGQQVSLEAGGKLAVKIKNSSYTGGEEVEGLVHILVQHILPPSTLILCFKGRETVKKIQASKQERETIQKHKLHSLKIVLLTWEEGIKRNNYSIPFTIILPEELDASLDFTTTHIQASITYTITAKLITHKKLLLGSAKVPLLILPNPQKEIKNQEVFQEFPLRSLCCCKRGYINISIKHPTNYYSSSHPAIVSIEIDNSRSSIASKSLTLTLSCILNIKNKDSIVLTNILDFYHMQVPVKIEPFRDDVYVYEAVIDLPYLSAPLNKIYSRIGPAFEILFVLRADLELNALTTSIWPCLSSYIQIIPNVYKPPSPKMISREDLWPLALKISPLTLTASVTSDEIEND
ncbi:hypothetical protein SteCoe_7495 [Stentor coeruleus]|uniref:Arrestin C-terminal-like domain-containing protein n=1 Tax=Stentor coeruleus TaxID=5963 RepID=A0A1R2CMM9_9CILI|nr:hypothetical protein SteCoe_7495 [Stentor coeruleus]